MTGEKEGVAIPTDPMDREFQVYEAVDWFVQLQNHVLNVRTGSPRSFFAAQLTQERSLVANLERSHFRFLRSAPIPVQV